MSVVQQFVFWLIINSHISPPPPSIPPKLMAVAKPVICGLENIKQNAKLKHALYQSFKKKKRIELCVQVWHRRICGSYFMDPAARWVYGGKSQNSDFYFVPLILLCGTSVVTHTHTHTQTLLFQSQTNALTLHPAASAGSRDPGVRESSFRRDFLSRWSSVCFSPPQSFHFTPPPSPLSRGPSVVSASRFPPPAVHSVAARRRGCK